MNYKQTLEEARKHEIDPLTLEVATEVEYFFSDEDISDEEFEKYCDLIERAYLKSEGIGVDDLARTLYRLICAEDTKFEDIDRHKLIAEVTYSI